MKDTNGAAAAVTDDEVVDGIKLLAETEGIFAETAGGVVISGLRRLVEQGHVHPDEVVVAFITGAGLKTQEAVAPALEAGSDGRGQHRFFRARRSRSGTASCRLAKAV